MGEFGIQQMMLNHPSHVHGLPGTAAEMSMPTGNNYSGQMINPFYSSGFDYPGLLLYFRNGQNSMPGTQTGTYYSNHLSISHQLRLLDQHQAGLLANSRNDGGVTEMQRIQHKLRELNEYRSLLLAMTSSNPISANQFQIYQPNNGYFQSSQDQRMSTMQWNNGSQQLNHHQMSAMLPKFDQQYNNLPISNVQSNNGSLHHPFQISGALQNGDSLHSHSQTYVTQLGNQSRQVFVPRPHLHQPSDGYPNPTVASSIESWQTLEVESSSQSDLFESEVHAATPHSASSSMSNGTAPFINYSHGLAHNTTSHRASNICQPTSGYFQPAAQPSIARYPQNSVEDARAT
jgi:hypothetical protein